MHLLVVPNRDRAVDTRDIFNQPQHERVAPPRCISVRCRLVITKTNLSKGALDKITSIGDEKAGASNLAHGSGNQMAQNEVYVNVIIGQLRGQGIAPLLKKSLAPRVSRQVRSGSPAAERAHCQDQTFLALLEDRSHNPSNLEGSQTVDGDDVLELVLWGLEKRYRHTVTLSDIVDQNGYIETPNQLRQLLVIGIIILGEVHGVNFHLKTTFSDVLLFEFFRKGLELCLGSGNENEVEALGSEL